MDKEFVAKGVVALAPITLGAVVFCLLSLTFYGYPINSFDVVLTHYKANLTAYSPALPLINLTAHALLGDYLYAFWWVLMPIAVCFVLPYILLFEITKKHRWGVVYLYGSAIPVIGFIGGLIPQAAIVCLILLFIARPKWFWYITLLAGVFHSFGAFAIIATRIWRDYDKNYPKSSFADIGQLKAV